jgi:transcriptional regulator with PAS, ATPase and Fis domain
VSEACRSPVPEEPGEFDIIGRSASIRRATELARRFAPTRLPILLVGATGTGKELLAQQIHRWSGRPGHLVDVNCGALPESSRRQQGEL